MPDDKRPESLTATPSSGSEKAGAGVATSTVKEAPRTPGAGQPVLPKSDDIAKEREADQQRRTALKERRAAIVGAEAVGEAMKKAADQVVAAAKGVAAVSDDAATYLVVTGSKFQIDGQYLGTNGVVTFDGVQAAIRGWGGTRIEGTVPAGASADAEVLVHIDGDTVKYARRVR